PESALAAREPGCLPVRFARAGYAGTMSPRACAARKDDYAMQEQIAGIIARLQALLAQDGLDAAAASELRYRLRQLEVAAAQLQRGDDREEAYGLLCDALLALARDGVLDRILPSSGPATPRSVPVTPE